ncbi:mediator complex subunit 15 domain-containing protein [Salinactinospora qingdaonensis]|uniref:Uncharacterized protein n=1 Tax=Salinactinospora qingdaonensis TaxID=702744 RepID=A0ABP7FYG0_9ACTN
MNSETIQRLREPAAWVLLGAVLLRMLAGLISTFASGAAGAGGAPVATNMLAQREAFFGPVNIGMIVCAVLLVATSQQKSPRTHPIVLTALVVTGVAGLLGGIVLIMGFIATGPYNAALGFSNFFTTVAYLAMGAVGALFELRIFNNHELVPRAPARAPAMGYPQTGAQPGFAGTGAQQSFAPQPDPNQTGQGYVAHAPGAYPSPQDEWAAHHGQYPQQEWGAQPYGGAVPGYGPGYAQTGGQQPYYPQYDPGAYAGGPYEAQQPSPDQQAYAQSLGQQPQEWQPGQPDFYGQYPQQGYAQAGGHPPYGQEWGQAAQVDQPPYAGQPSYSDSGGQPPGYDPYAAQQQPMAYGTGGQSGFGSGEGFPPSDQAAQQAIQYGWYQQPVDNVAPEPQPQEQRRDTPLEQFFQKDERGSGAAEATPRHDPGYPGAYGDNHPVDQQRHAGTDSDEQHLGWYRDDDRR